VRVRSAAKKSAASGCVLASSQPADAYWPAHNQQGRKQRDGRAKRRASARSTYRLHLRWKQHQKPLHLHRCVRSSDWCRRAWRSDVQTPPLLASGHSSEDKRHQVACSPLSPDCDERRQRLGLADSIRPGSYIAHFAHCRRSVAPVPLAGRVFTL